MEDSQSEARIAAPRRESRSWAVPTLRVLGRRVLQFIDGGGERGAEIADLVLADAWITLQVLAEANRAVAGVGAGVSSVPVALEIVGRDCLRGLVRSAISQGGGLHGEEERDLYRHSLLTSLVGECLARVVGTVNPDMARATGLLHDIGAWDPELRHDSEGLHATAGARLLRRSGLPDEMCRAVTRHHELPDSKVLDDPSELLNVLTMADRLAIALCASAGDGAHSADVDTGLPSRLRVLARIALDRAAREVGDSILVLGTLLGVPAMTIESLPADLARLAQNEGPAPLPPPGLALEIRNGLADVRQVASESEAVRTLMRVVRDAPGVRSALLVLSDAGEAMLKGHPERRPFFLRADDLGRIAENMTGFVNLVHDRGAGILSEAPGCEGAFLAFRCRKLLAVPLRAGGIQVGVIVAPDPGDDVTDATATGLGLVARAAGESLEALQLSRGSYMLAEKIATDALTGVLNRGPFFERFTTEVRAANRYRRALALAMIDIDQFKQWNDSYGHQVGDRLLRDVSKTIRDCAREGDMVGRYGGDEFVVSLPGCSVEQATAFCERVRERVEALGRVMRESCYDRSLSVSIGVTAASTWPCEADVLLFRADNALYRAKERGRNRVCADQN